MKKRFCVKISYASHLPVAVDAASEEDALRAARKSICLKSLSDAECREIVCHLTRFRGGDHVELVHGIEEGKKP